MYAVGYQTTPYRTGGERVLAHRVSDLYSYVAEADGTVVEVGKKHLIVEYPDKKVGVELGLRFGTASGTTYTHEIATDLEKGNTFKKGDVLAWNTNYFERDFMEPRQVSWKAGVMVRTALMEESYTYEDSSMISRKTANLLGTQIAKPAYIFVNFEQEVRNLVSVGDEVEQETILCTLENPVTANMRMDDDVSFDSLRIMSNDNPKAHANGKVTKIEVLYRGDIEKMSESLGVVANRSDLDRRNKNRKLMKSGGDTGEISAPIRVDGRTLEQNQAVIKVYITVQMPTVPADKGVFGAQMKSTFGYIYEDPMITESGKEVDAVFSNKSIANRMVTSPYVMGVVNTYLYTVTENAVAMWRRLRKANG